MDITPTRTKSFRNILKLRFGTPSQSVCFLVAITWGKSLSEKFTGDF